MTPTMKTFYDTIMLDNARDNLVYTQLGKKEPLPAHNGYTVEWRKWNTLPDADQLTEGVIPTGKKFGLTAINVTLTQHGLYVPVTDVLELHAVDDVIVGATEEVGASLGRSFEKVTRSALEQSSNNLLADALNSGAAGWPVASTPAARHLLSTAAATYSVLSPDMINQATTKLQQANAPYYDGTNYVGVLHPSVWYDLRNHPDWEEVHKYAATTEIFNGEVGMLHGVRFLKTTIAPVIRGADLLAAARTMTVTGYTAGTNTVAVSEEITAEDALALKGREIIIDGWHFTIATVAATNPGSFTLDDVNAALVEADTNVPANADVVYPGEGGAGGVSVYQTMIFGKDAFAVVDPDGAGIETIIHGKESGIGGPLNQFGTIGGKFESACKILYPERMVVIESVGKYSATDAAN
jgi:N4-gp56 family major capsid protein